MTNPSRMAMNTKIGRKVASWPDKTDSFRSRKRRLAASSTAETSFEGEPDGSQGTVRGACETENWSLVIGYWLLVISPRRNSQ